MRHIIYVYEFYEKRKTNFRYIPRTSCHIMCTTHRTSRKISHFDIILSYFIQKLRNFGEYIRGEGKSSRLSRRVLINRRRVVKTRSSLLLIVLISRKNFLIRQRTTMRKISLKFHLLLFFIRNFT